MQENKQLISVLAEVNNSKERLNLRRLYIILALQGHGLGSRLFNIATSDLSARFPFFSIDKRDVLSTREQKLVCEPQVNTDVQSPWKSVGRGRGGGGVLSRLRVNHTWTPDT